MRLPVLNPHSGHRSPLIRPGLEDFERCALSFLGRLVPPDSVGRRLHEVHRQQLSARPFVRTFRVFEWDSPLGPAPRERAVDFPFACELHRPPHAFRQKKRDHWNIEHHGKGHEVVNVDSPDTSLWGRCSVLNLVHGVSAQRAPTLLESSGQPPQGQPLTLAQPLHIRGDGASCRSHFNASCRHDPDAISRGFLDKRPDLAVPNLPGYAPHHR